MEDASGTTVFKYNKAGKAVGMIHRKQTYLLGTDQLGSVFAVADLSGNNVQEVLYDSFGRKIMNSNPEFNNPLGFAGGLYDEDTGLIHFGYREYDPVIGRFISPDPLGYDGGDVDLYGYSLMIRLTLLTGKVYKVAVNMLTTRKQILIPTKNNHDTRKKLGLITLIYPH
jgi:RHS repeat-associated protein